MSPFPSIDLILAGLAGFIAGLLAAWPAVRSRIARAHADGRASRDAEIATLGGQRDAEARRAEEFAARIQRYEHEWTQAEQNLRKVTAHAAASSSATSSRAFMDSAAPIPN